MTGIKYILRSNSSFNGIRQDGRKEEEDEEGRILEELSMTYIFGFNCLSGKVLRYCANEYSHCYQAY